MKVERQTEKQATKETLGENPWEWIKATSSLEFALRHTRKWKWGGHSHCSKATEALRPRPPQRRGEDREAGPANQPSGPCGRARSAEPPSVRLSASAGGRASCPAPSSAPAARACEASRAPGAGQSGGGSWSPPPGPVPCGPLRAARRGCGRRPEPVRAGMAVTG